jgi:hypothetical protein
VRCCLSALDIVSEGKKRKRTQPFRRENGKPRKLTAFLRMVVSSLDFGIKGWSERKQKVCPLHFNTKKRILAAFENKRLRSLARLSNEDLRRHHSDIKDFYFAGNSSPSDRYTMFLLDADCHESGDRDEALRFLESLNDDLPNFSELSKRGAHGFPILDKEERGAEIINQTLSGLARVLDRKRQAEGWDIEKIEIKGRLPRLVWKDNKLSFLKLGTLAQLPKDFEGFDAWRQEEHVITMTQLQKLLWKLEQQFPEPVVTKVRTQRKLRVSSGSVKEHFFDENELRHARPGGHYFKQASILLRNKPLATSYGSVATVQDLAIFLMIGRRLTTDIAPNGGNPWKTWAKVWEALKEDEKIGRAFCPKRFAVLRNYLSSLELLDWKNKVFKIGHFDDEGQYHKGFCAKWKFSAPLMEALDWQSAEKEHERRRKLLTAGVEVDDERETVKHTAGSALFLSESWDEFTQNLAQKPRPETIRPLEIDEWVRQMSSLPDLLALAA